MESNRGVVFLVVFCVILAVVAVTYVTRTVAQPAGPAVVQVTSDGVPAALAPAKAPADPVPAAPKNPEAAKTEAAPADPAPPQDIETAHKPDPKLIVPPVEEPEMLLDVQEGKKYFYAPLANGGGFVFERRVESGKRVSGVIVPGTILVTRGLVELFGCGDGGKEHETVLRLECDVQSLDMAFTLAGFKRGRLPTKLDLSEAGQGTRLVILVQWTDKAGKVVTHRSEDLVVSVRRRAPMPRVGWTFVGEWIKVLDPTSPKGEKKLEVLSAGQTKSFVTTFRDRSALLDNPLDEAVDDTLFAANYMVLPESGTPVRVIFRAPLEAEKTEIAALEKAIALEPRFQPPAHEDHDDPKDEKKK